MSKIVLTEEIIVKMEKNLFQIYAVGNVFALYAEEDFEKCDSAVGSGFSQLGEIVKKLAGENLDIVLQLKT